MSQNSPPPEPATSLVHGILADGRQLLFVGEPGTPSLFMGEYLVRVERKIKFTRNETGTTITWQGQNNLHIPLTGDKASLNGQEFEIQRIPVGPLPVAQLLCTAFHRMPVPLAMR